MFGKKFIKRLIWTLFIVFILMNVVAYFHASKFTHFDKSITKKTGPGKKLSFGQKLKVLFLGIDNPRPVNKIIPAGEFETISLKSNKEIECWKMKADSSKGTVVIFHGYSGNKSSMLDKAEIFLNLGYSTMLVDFMGSGGSEGDQTTIGFHEAAQVKTAFEYLEKLGEKNIILFGTSMGAAAIMKAQSDHHLKPAAVILECPFGSMLQTVEARFHTMKVPTFPMANLLVFWGGFQNDFNAFDHNPIDYAKNIGCSALLLYGLKDEEVSRQEIDDIFKNMTERKEMRTYPLAGHENYLKKYKNEWTNDIALFLKSIK